MNTVQRRILSPLAQGGKNKFMFKPWRFFTNLAVRITSWRALVADILYWTSLIYLCNFPSSVLGLNLSYCGTENTNLIAVPVQFGFS